MITYLKKFIDSIYISSLDFAFTFCLKDRPAERDHGHDCIIQRKCDCHWQLFPCLTAASASPHSLEKESLGWGSHAREPVLYGWTQ